jgi:hypothetical protein
MTKDTPPSPVQTSDKPTFAQGCRGFAAFVRSNAFEMSDRDMVADRLEECADAMDRKDAALLSAESRGERKGIERAADVAKKHGDFCYGEATNGGSRDLFERAAGARYIAPKIRALPLSSPEEG